MSASLRYLEAAKVEELARELTAAGYQVITDLKDDNVVYDLVASNNERRIVIAVKARSDLQNAAQEIRKLREQAKRHGYDDFRLVIVNPPREKVIEVEELDSLLFEHLINNIPGELDELSSHTSVDGVSQTDISGIKVTRNGIQIIGTGIVEVTLEYGGGEAQDGAVWDADFPFTFDILLSHQFEIEEVYELVVDSSSFHE